MVTPQVTRSHLRLSDLIGPKYNVHCAEVRKNRCQIECVEYVYIWFDTKDKHKQLALERKFEKIYEDIVDFEGM